MAPDFDRIKVDRIRAAAAAGAGAVLAGATRALSAVRPSLKPLHPQGKVVEARLDRMGARPPTGVPWLDEAGVDEVLVRRSRAVGLPEGAPDIHGLALRVPREDGYGDLLLASTGLGRVTRFVLTGSRSPLGRPLTTLLPYRTPHGPLLLAAVPQADHEYRLECASPTGPWRPFGMLRLSGTESADALVSFDPVRNTVPGLENYEWVRRLREPAYLTARRTRDRD
jgi:hypothetical protein